MCLAHLLPHVLIHCHLFCQRLHPYWQSIDNSVTRRASCAGSTKTVLPSPAKLPARCGGRIQGEGSEC
ncbi:hypothetical protein [Bacteroides helcogenes]|uniref:hypothetical protein n=1 Tax=Bacteroides helcogenes TaxID=290053 RepID=UPI000306ECFA|nr:hypothetical protein [Bacteroides helcogenes]MDY5237002.1 hypothetical protein [Bacteroides helcogenes]